MRSIHSCWSHRSISPSQYCLILIVLFIHSLFALHCSVSQDYEVLDELHVIYAILVNVWTVIKLKVANQMDQFKIEVIF